MRPLEVSVMVEEREEEDKFVLNLPDGTSHKHVSEAILHVSWAIIHVNFAIYVYT